MDQGLSVALIMNNIPSIMGLGKDKAAKVSHRGFLQLEGVTGSKFGFAHGLFGKHDHDHPEENKQESESLTVPMADNVSQRSKSASPGKKKVKKVQGAPQNSINRKRH